MLFFNCLFPKWRYGTCSRLSLSALSFGMEYVHGFHHGRIQIQKMIENEKEVTTTLKFLEH
jgi:hypothetical protein